MRPGELKAAACADRSIYAHTVRGRLRRRPRVDGFGEATSRDMSMREMVPLKILLSFNSSQVNGI